MLTLPARTGCFSEQKRVKCFKNHDEYLARIEKSLYYVYLPKAYCTSFPCTELAAEIFSGINKFSIDQLRIDEAATLSHNACVSPSSLVLALLYLERLKTFNPKYLQKVSPSELFLISLMVGSKFLQDDGQEDEVNNYEWAASAGIDVDDVNKAEKQFLEAIKWEVYVSEKEFWDRFHVLECKLGLRQGCKRGWFTYTELNMLLELIDITAVIQALCTVTTACLTSYTASMLTLLGSALLVSQIPGLGLRPKMQEYSSNHNLSNVAPFNFASNYSMEPNIKDRSVTHIGFTLSDVELPDRLTADENGHSFNDLDDMGCRNGNPLQFVKLSPVTSHDASESTTDFTDFTAGIRAELFEKCGNFWKWTNIITNCLLMNSMSVSTNLFPIINF